MRSFRAYSVAIVLLLVVCVGLKVGLRGLNEAGGEDPRVQVTALAMNNGFWLERMPSDDSQLKRIAVSKGACRATITFASPLGYNRDSIRRAATSDDEVFFVYQGRRFDTQPLWQTVTDHYRSRLGRIFGITPQPETVLGVVASHQCAPSDLDWL